MSSRCILHVDMDAFFAAVEVRDHPEYAGKPVVVGADPMEGKGRGVVSAASYEARKFGIHSAQPISQAYRRCPAAIFVSPNYAAYQDASRQVMAILGDFSPELEQISVDEAFLDCTGSLALFGTGPQIARKIKDRVKNEVRLVASVGVAPNKFVAKIASDLDKPDGLAVCPPGKERQFLADLPIKRLWGVGRKTEEKLLRQGFKTIGDVAASSPEALRASFGKWGLHLWELSHGRDERPVTSGGRRKSISEEHTYEQDTASDEVVEGTILRICDTLSRSMRKKKIRGRTVTLKVRLEGFETFTRSRTVEDPLDGMQAIKSVAMELYRNFDRGGKKVRLIGVGLSNLLFEGDTMESEQQDLFAQKSAEPSPTDRVLDDLKAKFGDRVGRGSLLG